MVWQAHLRPNLIVGHQNQKNAKTVWFFRKTSPYRHRNRFPKHQKNGKPRKNHQNDVIFGEPFFSHRFAHHTRTAIITHKFVDNRLHKWKIYIYKRCFRELRVEMPKCAVFRETWRNRKQMCVYYLLLRVRMPHSSTWCIHNEYSSFP